MSKRFTVNGQPMHLTPFSEVPIEQMRTVPPCDVGDYGRFVSQGWEVHFVVTTMEYVGKDEESNHDQDDPQ